MESKIEISKLSQKQKSIDTIARFFRPALIYQKLKDADRYQLFKERRHHLYEALFELSIDKENEIYVDSLVFIDQWGKHIGEIIPSAVENLLIKQENQFSPTLHVTNHYYRSLYYQLIPLVKRYIATVLKSEAFADKKYPISHTDSFFPLDRFFPVLNQIDKDCENRTITDSSHQHFVLCLNSPHKTKILDEIVHSGLMPTPFKMRYYVAQYHCLETTIEPENKTTLPIHPLKTLEQLFLSPSYLKFSRLKDDPTKTRKYVTLFSQAIVSLLEGLNYEMNNIIPSNRQLFDKKLALLKHSYSFLEIYLDLVYFYKDDQQRSALFFEWMIEEIIFSLLLLKPYKPTDFSTIFKAILQSNYQQSFALSDKIEINTGLFNSGSRAFFEALSTCLHFNPHANIACTTNVYFETILCKQLTHTKLIDFSNLMLSEGNADIYVICLASVLQATFYEIYPINLHDFLSALFLKRTISTPVTIIIDVTAYNLMDKELLQILKDYASQLEQGLLNLIFYESLQKYGMLNSDKVQAGCIWCVNHTFIYADFNKKITDITIQNKDFDYQLICHIFKYAYPQTRGLFKLSEENGKIIREHITHKKIEDKNTPFLYDLDFSGDKIDNFKRIFPSRQSFGYANTVTTAIIDRNSFFGPEYIIRLSAGCETEQTLIILAKLTNFPLPKNYECILKKIGFLIGIEHSTSISVDKLFTELFILFQDSSRIKLSLSTYGHDFIVTLVLLLKCQEKIANHLDRLKRYHQVLQFHEHLLRSDQIKIPSELIREINKDFNQLKRKIIDEVDFFVRTMPNSLIKLDIKQETVLINIARLQQFYQLLFNHQFMEDAKTIHHFLLDHADKKLSFPIKIGLIIQLIEINQHLKKRSLFIQETEETKVFRIS